MEKKITKKEMFGMIREAVADNADMVAFIDHEIELLDKKSAVKKKPTATQIANESYKETILSVLSSEGMTASEVLQSSDEFVGMSNQKISALLKMLCEEGKAIKTVDKKKSYFTLA